MNPLLKIRLNWWENKVVSQLLGHDWQAKLWTNITTAFTEWLATNAAPDLVAVTAFLNSHFDQAVEVLVHGNFVLATIIDGLFAKLISGLAAELLASVSAAAQKAA